MEDYIVINGFRHDRYLPEQVEITESLKRSKVFFEHMKQRRSIRQFSTKKFPFAIIEHCIATAASAPSGANKQPWTFCVVESADIKSAIRQAAEEEEQLSYNSRMNEEWLKDLAPLGTDAHKPFLEDAPYLIVLFKQSYTLDQNNQRSQNYYVNESVGIAAGFLISAIHQAGLVTITHTPSPMNFLTKILNRPENEKPFLLLPVGYPAKEVYVPNIEKKDLKQVLIRF